jgi:hypothetical protein
MLYFRYFGTVVSSVSAIKLSLISGLSTCCVSNGFSSLEISIRCASSSSFEIVISFGLIIIFG